MWCFIIFSAYNTVEMTSLISLDHELKAVKGKLDDKVYQCKREQLEKDFSELSEDELNMENAIKDAALTFEVVRNETKSIRTLKSQLDEVKEGLGKEVAKTHGQLKEALYKMKISKSCSPSVHKFNAIMLEKKVEGSEMQLEMGLKKLRKIEVFEKELDTATADLLSVLSTYQKRCVDRIIRSPTTPKEGSVVRIPTKQSAQVDVIVESIRYLREENEKLKADLESMVTSGTPRNQDSAKVQELENEVTQLKLQVFALQNEAMEREKRISLPIIKEELSSHQDTATSGDESSSFEIASVSTITASHSADPAGKRADELVVDPVDDQPEVKEQIVDQVDKKEEVISRGIIPAAKESDEESVESADEEDSYGFEDMSPSPVPMPKPVVELEDKLAELELHDMGDIKLVQPDYEQLVMDQMRHEEELEEYAVQILGLKETIAELEEENRELKGQLAFAEGDDASASEIQQLESEVAMWRLKYEESAAGSAQVHRLRVELERTKAKSKKRITVLQEDLQTLQKNGSDRIKNLIHKFRSFQEEGAARVQTLEAELEKSRAEVDRLKNGPDDDTEAETDSSEPGLHDPADEDDEVDETDVVEVSSQSPECAGEEDVTDGVNEIKQVRSESNADKMVSDTEETRTLLEQLQAMKKAKEEAEQRSFEEIMQLQDTITSLRMEKEMKQEVISSLHDQLHEAEQALTEQSTLR